MSSSAGVLVWHIHQIKTPPRTVEIGLIWDEANELAPHRGPHTNVPSLGENLVDTIEKAQAATQTTSEPTDTTLVKSFPGGSTAPRSSRSTPSATLVPLARSRKLRPKWSLLCITSSRGCRGLLLRRRREWSGKWPSTRRERSWSFISAWMFLSCICYPGQPLR